MPGDAPAPLPAEIERVEALGASLLVHFTVDAAAAKTAGIAAATGGGIDEAALVERTGALFCASFEPRGAARSATASRSPIDTRRLHFFDPDSEAAVVQAGAAPQSHVASV